MPMMHMKTFTGTRAGLLAVAGATGLATFSGAALAGSHSEAEMQDGNVTLAPEIQEFVDSLKGAEPIYKLSPEDARQRLIDAQKGGDLPAASVEEKTLPVGPTGEVKVYAVRPEGRDGEALPGVVYYHGGGWILGNFTTHERLIRELANQTEAVYVFVEYAPAPEQKHPVQIEQDYAVLDYVAKNGGEFGIDAERLATAGDSVGGQMVASVAMMAAEQGGPEIDAQVMFYPVTTADLTSPSYDEFADGPWLRKKAMEWFWDAYLPEDVDPADPMVSPLNASAEQLASFAPTLVITDQNDVLRDEGEAFADKLVKAGVETEATRYLHTMHDFVMLNAISETAPTRAAIEQAAGFLKTHLAGDAGAAPDKQDDAAKDAGSTDGENANDVEKAEGSKAE